jgi:hypothetical protein
MAHSEPAPDPQQRATHRFLCIALATFLGGAFATGHVVFENLRASGRSGMGYLALGFFAALGAAYLWYMKGLPHDALSRLFMHLPFAAVLLVPAYLFNRPVISGSATHAQIHKPLWAAPAIGLSWALVITCGLWTLVWS